MLLLLPPKLTTSDGYRFLQVHCHHNHYCIRFEFESVNIYTVLLKHIAKLNKKEIKEDEKKLNVEQAIKLGTKPKQSISYVFFISGFSEVWFF